MNQKKGHNEIHDILWIEKRGGGGNCAACLKKLSKRVD